MSAPPIVIVGAGGHARVVADIVHIEGSFAIAGFLDDVDRHRHGESFCNARVLGGFEQLEALRAQGVRHAFVAIGDCESRLRAARRALAVGFELPVMRHPNTVVANDVNIGIGTVLAAGCVINPAAQVGANVIVNTSASIDHDCLIEDGVHVGPGARLGGRVMVGLGSWIGIGATVSHGVRVGAGSILGAGAVAVRDIPDGVVAYGVPAKVMREVAHGQTARH